MTAIKRYRNLNKSLIIIHDGSDKNSIGHHEAIWGILDTSGDAPSISLLSLCDKLRDNFANPLITPKSPQSPVVSSPEMSKEMLDILRDIE